MIIECFWEPLVYNGNIENKLSSFRYGWKERCKNKPIKKNVYNINKDDFIKLVEIMDNTAVICKEFEAEFISGKLFLKSIDNKKGDIHKDGFMQNIK